MKKKYFKLLVPAFIIGFFAIIAQIIGSSLSPDSKGQDIIFAPKMENHNKVIQPNLNTHETNIPALLVLDSVISTDTSTTSSTQSSSVKKRKEPIGNESKFLTNASGENAKVYNIETMTGNINDF